MGRVCPWPVGASDFSDGYSSAIQVMQSAPRYGCIKRTEADRVRR